MNFAICHLSPPPHPKKMNLIVALGLGQCGPGSKTNGQYDFRFDSARFQTYDGWFVWQLESLSRKFRVILCWSADVWTHLWTVKFRLGLGFLTNRPPELPKRARAKIPQHPRIIPMCTESLRRLRIWVHIHCMSPESRVRDLNFPNEPSLISWDADQARLNRTEIRIHFPLDSLGENPRSDFHGVFLI